MTDRGAEVLAHLGSLVEQLGTVSRCVRTLYGPVSGRGAWMGCEGGAELAVFLFDVVRTRDAIFGPVVADEGCWGMLLDLAKAEMEAIPLSVTSLCSSTSLPQTSAIRKLDNLVQAGLVVRLPDERDRRRSLVELTDKARQAMNLLYEQTVGRRSPKNETEHSGPSAQN